jgi:adenylate cyclase
VILGYYFNSEKNAVESGALPEPVLPAETFRGRRIDVLGWRGYTGNLPEFQSVLAGHFNPRVDKDGRSRRVPMLAEYKGRFYEAFSLAVVRTYLGIQEAVRTKATRVTLPGVVINALPDRFVTPGYTGVEWLEVGPLKVPVDDELASLVPYRGPEGVFPTFRSPTSGLTKSRSRSCGARSL